MKGPMILLLVLVVPVSAGRALMVLGDDAIVARVAATPGAIGFVDHSRVTADVEVLREVEQ